MAEGTFLNSYSTTYALDNISKHVGIVHGRTLLVDVIREIFSREKEYHYVSDIFGHPKTPSNLGLPIDAGIDDQLASRIYIGTVFRYDAGHLPSVSIRQTSIAYKPISFNQNRYTVDYEKQRFEDGYGNVSFISVPSKYIFAGAWDQNFEIKIVSTSYEDTSAIADLILISLQTTYRNTLERNGLFIRQVSAGGESSESIGRADPIFVMSLSVSTFSEWRREIPISNLLERIQLCFHFDLGSDLDVTSTDLDIKYTLD